MSALILAVIALVALVVAVWPAHLRRPRGEPPVPRRTLDQLDNERDSR